MSQDNIETKQPTHYSISEHNIRNWFRSRKTQIVSPMFDHRHDEEKFVQHISLMLDEMNDMRN